jgi:hypothetical protein
MRPLPTVGSRAKVIDWDRHDHHIHEKVVEWVLRNRGGAGKPSNPSRKHIVHGIWMRQGVLLSILNSLKVLVGKHELKIYRGAGVKRTLFTAIECIPGDGRYHPL